MDIVPKNYAFATVKGITQKQLQEHYTIYKGYVTKLNEIDSASRNAADFPNPNATYSSLRSLKLGETYALDGIKLHELYFENITNSTCCIDGEMLKLIKNQWNSYENFMSYIKNTGLSMRGWIIIALDPLTYRLRVIGSDAHDVGAVWDCYPILVIDVYEHAYFLDFGTNKGKYLEVIFENINWKVVNKRIQIHYMMMNMMKRYFYDF
ncbi:superoxide dismutase [Clostridium polyendosporum]|uniref:superoxide dismutase n=1 Tax=Clostridium polyendosporum TaxID=69208 RepID=A0A919VEA7_9CLOT|nr:superoxide dismutase [Clostridium polyendosporum]GIM28949.1 superoxide dismutase [Clostridium polyendosporum]